MSQEDALEVLNSDDALEKRFSAKQFTLLAVTTIAFPLAIIIAVGVSL